MLDENLPTFFTRQSPDNPLSSVVYFTQNGAEPTPEYSFRRPEPALPQSRNKYAAAITDAYSQQVIFAEVLVEPEWQQPTLSAAEIRAQNGATPPPVPLLPDSFTILMYNPDQQVSVRGEKSTWTGKESWEFEMPQQSFRMPSSSKLDQESNPVASDLAPKILFRWKRDSKFSKDMTCYMCGKSLGGKKSKEPDITVALYKHGREPAVTIYEPNLQRVEVEDRKGLEVVLLLGAEVIRDIYLFPSRDSFNITGVPPAKRKNSRPVQSSCSPKPQPPANGYLPANANVNAPANAHNTAGAYSMSGGLSNTPPATNMTSPAAPQNLPPSQGRNQAEIDAETKRLQFMVQQEEREREKRDRAEAKRIQKMLDEEEKERQRREAEIAKETERLKKEFGLQGQDYQAASKPSLPARLNGAAAGPSHSRLLQPGLQPPPRSASAAPSRGGGFGSWWHGPVMTAPGMPPQQAFVSAPQQPPQHIPGRGRGGSADGNKIAKKRSVFF